MPKHFQTLALHWFICFVNHNPNNPQISMGGREGGVGRRDGCAPREDPSAFLLASGRLGTDIYDGQTRWRRKTT